MDDITATIRGVTVGKGTVYRWASWPESLMSTPSIRTADVPRSGRNGVTPGPDLLGAGKVVFDLHVLGSDLATMEGYVADLTEAFAPSSSDIALDVRMSGTPDEYRFYGRPRGVEVAWPRTTRNGVCRARALFVATDPLRYSTTESTASTGLTTLSGGLDFPATAPFVFGTAGDSSVMDCTNDGTIATPWVATFSGPLTAPELVHLGSGKRITLSGATLAAGETLVVDSDARTVLLEGTASRYSWLAAASQWFDIEPGANSVQLLGASGSGSVSLAWRSAWI